MFKPFRASRIRNIVDEMRILTESRSVVKISVVVTIHFEFESKGLLLSLFMEQPFLETSILKAVVYTDLDT